MITIQHHYPEMKKVAARLIAPLLLLGGFASVLLGIVMIAVIELRAGLSLLFCGIASMAFGQIIELMMAIESDLAAIRARIDTGVLGEIALHLKAVRSQMGKGVFGLLGM